MRTKINGHNHSWLSMERTKAKCFLCDDQILTRISPDAKFSEAVDYVKAVLDRFLGCRINGLQRFCRYCRRLLLQLGRKYEDFDFAVMEKDSMELAVRQRSCSLLKNLEAGSIPETTVQDEQNLEDPIVEPTHYVIETPHKVQDEQKLEEPIVVKPIHCVIETPHKVQDEQKLEEPIVVKPTQCVIETETPHKVQDEQKLEEPIVVKPTHCVIDTPHKVKDSTRKIPKRVTFGCIKTLVIDIDGNKTFTHGEIDFTNNKMYDYYNKYNNGDDGDDSGDATCSTNCTVDGGVLEIANTSINTANIDNTNSNSVDKAEKINNSEICFRETPPLKTYGKKNVTNICTTNNISTNKDVKEVPRSARTVLKIVQSDNCEADVCNSVCPPERKRYSFHATSINETLCIKHSSVAPKTYGRKRPSANDTVNIPAKTFVSIDSKQNTFPSPSPNFGNNVGASDDASIIANEDPASELSSTKDDTNSSDMFKRKENCPEESVEAGQTRVCFQPELSFFTFDTDKCKL